MTRFARTLAATWMALSVLGAQAQPAVPSGFDTEAGNLLAVLRPSDGGSQPQETLQPYGKLVAELPDGREVELEMSWFRYVGDMHIRLVFDSRTELQSASPDDLQRLRLAPEQAVQLAVQNMRRTYGEPDVQPWQGGLMQVLGRADDLNSSYFLDRPFWRALEARHPRGVVAAVPVRGGLLYAPVDDDEAVATLRFSATALYAASARRRVSSALYLFKDGHWSVFQPPLER
ncbi:hypothetical protein PE066_20090 [Ramlibacter tataouinensis]|uniref:hypothetical protein n=1 Tax=Ramlibacter tataouinensis TaxID=94132 RepID=UPI0022F3F7D8|nr:hypothetical protein [Ramlibacter tataouinensis]WBY01724.1 hypothetical protein PE066_20090 [Ramlibacter tataouinensis]